MEEERRLAYVGITRAEETLYLMNANQRVLYGKTNYNRPSRFISEIDDELLEYAGIARKANSSFNASYKSGGFASGISMSDALHQRKAVINPTAAQATINNSETEDWQIGDTAIHRKWGEGMVLGISGSGKNMELKINFPEVGMKRLLAAMAPIEKNRKSSEKIMTYHELEQVELTNMCAIIDEKTIKFLFKSVKNHGLELLFLEDIWKKVRLLFRQQ